MIIVLSLKLQIYPVKIPRIRLVKKNCLWLNIIMDNSPEGQNPTQLSGQSSTPPPSPAQAPDQSQSQSQSQSGQSKPNPQPQLNSSSQPSRPLSSQKVDYFKNVEQNKPLLEEKVSDYRKDPKNQVHLSRKMKIIIISSISALIILVVLLILWFFFWAPEEIRIKITDTATPQESETVQAEAEKIFNEAEDSSTAGLEASEYYQKAIQNAKDDNERFDMQIDYSAFLTSIGDPFGGIEVLDEISTDGLTNYQKGTLYLQYYSNYYSAGDEASGNKYYYLFYELEGQDDEDMTDEDLNDLQNIEQESGL